MDTVIAVIENHTPELQVMIEARIVETTKRFAHLGVAWALTASPTRARQHDRADLLNNVSGTGGQPADRRLQRLLDRDKFSTPSRSMPA
jgi:type II secretory pathway component GspD/PulD (secretin)